VQLLRNPMLPDFVQLMVPNVNVVAVSGMAAPLRGRVDIAGIQR
jgi:hypothetical protein